MAPTVLNRLGGYDNIRAAVDMFYDRVLADDRVSGFFKGADMDMLHKKQVMFMQYAFEGRETYPGKDLYEAHKHLIKERGLNQTHFDIIVEHFVLVLEELKIPQDVVKACLAVLAPARDLFQLRQDGIDTAPGSTEPAVESLAAGQADVMGASTAASKSAGPTKADKVDPTSSTTGTAAAAAAPAAARPPSVYERLGGADAVRAAVDIFYVKMLGDERVARFFQGVDMAGQKRKQAMFMQYAFGGAEHYKGKDLYSAHKRMMQEQGLNQGHFDVVVEHFVATLEQLNVDKAIIQDCVAVLAPARDIFQLREEDRNTAPACDTAPPPATTPTPQETGSAESGSGSVEPAGAGTGSSSSTMAAAPAAARPPSVYERLGGADAVRAAVDIFYVKMLGDERVARFFQGVDMAGQKRKQAMFMQYAFGGAEHYKGKDLYSTHKRMMQEQGLNQGHFDVVVEHFVATLEQLNVDKAIIQDCVAVLAPARDIFQLREEDKVAAPPQPPAGSAPAPSAVPAAPLSAPRSSSFSLLQRIGSTVKAAVEVLYPKSVPAGDSGTAAASAVADKAEPEGAAAKVGEVTAAAKAAPSRPPSVYERLGGADAVRAAVDIFYVKMLGDERVARFFQGVDMAGQKRKQVMFMQYAFGGAEHYKGKDLYSAHKRMMQEQGLNQGHFDVVVEHFVATLEQLNVDKAIIQDCVAVLAPARDIFQLREEDKVATTAASS